MSDFKSLKVAEKIHETNDSCSFLFEISPEDQGAFKYIAGQYLTLRLEVNDKEERRAYSIFTAPHSHKLGVTVKRVANGKVSNYLIDKIFVGDQIDVMPPEGKFLLEPIQDKLRDHYFIAGGSGITPVMSMIETVLENEPKSTCYLLYANRNENCIIFNDALKTLEEQYQGQVHVEHILSQPNKEKAGGLKGMFGGKTTSWKGLTGRISNAVLESFLAKFPSKSGENTFYLCGPGGIIQTTENYLKSVGYDQVQIKKEFFTAATDPNAKAATVGAAAASGSTQVEAKINGQTFNIEMSGDQTVLEALLDKGVDAPYSCTSGACSTCVAKVSEGDVTMDACFALDDVEIKDGFVLTCQARSQSPVVKLDFDA